MQIVSNIILRKSRHIVSKGGFLNASRMVLKFRECFPRPDIHIFRFVFLLLSFILLITSCKKQLEVDTPVFNSNQITIYKNDASAASVLSGIYTKMSQGDLWRLSGYAGLSADELSLYSGSTSEIYLGYYRNALRSSSGSQNIGNDMWSIFYPFIYYSNEAINGLTVATELTPAVKQQLIGECKFVRAFSYFYLINLYGDVPYTTSTDYHVNSVLTKTSKDEIWKNIIADLKDARSLLSDNFLDATVSNVTSDRVRPTKWAASALLARAYLYTGAYAEAEIEATAVINNTTLFNLSPLDEVFLKNSNETIWQLEPVNYGVNTPDARFYILPSTGFSNDTPVYLSDTLIKNFEPGDLRMSNWVNSISLNGKVYNYPYKYRVNVLYQEVTEYTMVLRLAEQYLIRAEARINQSGKIADGILDLNVLRGRSRAAATTSVPDPLPPLSVNMTKESALSAVAHERRVELFTEWGHRWLDLKRTNKVNEVMSVITPQKGGVWNSNWQLYPIPVGELEKNKNIKQNQGYN